MKKNSGSIGFATGMLLIFALAAGAQDAPPAGAGLSFERIRIEKARKFVLNVESGSLESITGGFDIVLLPGEGSTEEVRLRGETLEIPATADGAPGKIVLKTNVIINHPVGNISADKAEWDQARNVIVFTGNPVINTPKVKELRGSQMTLDLNPPSQFSVENAKANEIDLRQDESEKADAAPNDPALLRAADVQDWKGLLAQIKSQAAAKDPSPGRQLMSLLDKATRDAFGSLSTEQEPGNEIKMQIVSKFNTALRNKGFYSAPAWNGIALSADAKALLDKGIDALAPEEVTKLNRRLLEAAYPGAVAPAA